MTIDGFTQALIISCLLTTGPMFARAAKGWQRWGVGLGAVAGMCYAGGPLAFSEPDAKFSKEALLRHPRILVHDIMAKDGSLLKEVFGIDPGPARGKLKNMQVFAGTSVPDLAQDVAYELDATLGKINVSRFADGEIGVQVEDSVRGKDVYIVQSTSQPANENLMELLLSISALRRASAGKITAVIPYYGYLRDVGTVSTLTHQLKAEVLERLDSEVMSSMREQQQQSNSANSNSSNSNSTSNGMVVDAHLHHHHHHSTGGPLHGGLPISPSDMPLMSDLTSASPPPPMPQEDWGRVSNYPISAADIAKMLETAGCDRVISVDLQPPGSAQIEGFFNMPVENVRATPICVDHLSKLKLNRPVIVAPNEACIQLAHDVAAGLQQKQGSHVGFAVTLEGGPSRGTDRYVHRGPPVAPSSNGTVEEPPIELVGDVRGAYRILGVL